VNPRLTSVVPEIGTLRSVGAGSGQPLLATRWMWKRSHGSSIAAPPNERGGNSCDGPTATAPHLDSTREDPKSCRLTPFVQPTTPMSPLDLSRRRPASALPKLVLGASALPSISNKCDYCGTSNGEIHRGLDHMRMFKGVPSKPRNFKDPRICSSD
jgi:hypothetical protein